MGFEPQTADQPLVNTRKRTTKVNIAVVIAVFLFIAAGVLSAFWAERNHQRGEPVLQPAAATP